MKQPTRSASFQSRLRRGVSLLILLLAASLLAACGTGASAAVVVAGSTSVQPFAEILAEEYMIQHPDASIDVQGGGSSAGIRAAQSGTAGIGMSSRSLKDDEKELWSVEIARDGLAVIVNPDNPISDLSLDQVRDIYYAAVTNWRELGGVDAKIHVIAREEGSGTRSAFEDLVMDDLLITPRAIVQDSNGAVKQLVADDPNAIGFVSLGLVDDSVKALSLGGVAANQENVLNDSYALSRPFLFITVGEPTGQVRQFIDFTLSEEGRKLLSAEGLVPSAGSAEGD